MKKKPEAPVETMPKKKGEERRWRWHGESIKSKDLIREHTYTAAQLRKAGFKLPKIKEIQPPPEPEYEVSFSLTKSEAYALSHAIDCNSECAYPEQRNLGLELLRRLHKEILVGIW